MSNSSSTNKTARLPVCFVCHGAGPMPALCNSGVSGFEHHDDLVAGLHILSNKLPMDGIKAVLIVSAHWDNCSTTTINTAAHPAMIYDYSRSSFPDEAFSIQYSAPGSPELASRVKKLMELDSIPCQEDSARGWDHGVWVPLSIMFPNASIPILEISIMTNNDPMAHMQLGKALSPLRDEGVLILGSGMTYHNLAYMNGYTRTLKSTGKPPAVAIAPESAAFDSWIQKACALKGEERQKMLTTWAEAPNSRDAFPESQRPPTGDDFHMMPLMVCVGAASDDDPGTPEACCSLFGCQLSSFLFGNLAAVE